MSTHSIHRPVTHLVHDQLVVDSLLGHQLIVRALLRHPALLEADDDVRSLDGGQAMGNDDGRPALSGLSQSTDKCLGA